MTQMQDRPSSTEPYLSGDGRPSSSERRSLWPTVGILYSWRRFIVGVTVAGALAAVGISLLLPNQYAASSRLLAPESGGNALASSVLKSLPSAASLLMGGQSGEYARYLTILSSRAMFESAVDSFNLVEAYETAKSDHPREEAIETLRKNADFPVHEKYEYLSVVIIDKDPQRAADIANFMVRRLNRVNSDLSSQNASLFRGFVERRYREANAQLDSVLNARQQFQKQYGVFDLPTQTSAFLEQVASMRAASAENEVQYAALRAQLGDDNAQVRQMREVVQAARRQYDNALEGQERVFPVPQEQMSDVLREYIDLERETLVQSQIIEVIAPVLEQARFNQEQEIQALQVVDPAVPPVRKVAPRRSIIVIISTLSIFLLSVMFALASSWWQRNHGQVASRLYDVKTADRQPRAKAEV